MKYKIVEFFEDFGQIQVEFEKTGITIPIDLPIDDNGNYPEGDELTELILQSYPSWYVDRKSKIASGVKNVSKIKKLVKKPKVEEVEPVLNVQPTVEANPVVSFEEQEAMQKEALTDIVNSILKEKGII